MSRDDQMNRGRRAANLAARPLLDMKTEFERDNAALGGILDWMTWTLGYCREVCGVASNG